MTPLPLVEGLHSHAGRGRAHRPTCPDFDFGPANHTLRAANGESGREGDLTALARFFEEVAT